MKKKQIVISKNYLKKIPARPDGLSWSTDEAGIVTLEISNTGWANRIAQKFFKRPKVSFVHLDEMGSFIWPVLDGKMDIVRIGELVEEHFGEAAHPLYERLARYFQILDSYHFVKWVGEDKKKKKK